MLKKKENPAQLSFYSSFEEQLNHKHPLYILTQKINWQIFEDEFKKYYSEDTGCPAKPIRLMVGLLMLKHVRDLSDESVVEQWAENSYYQYFTGELLFASEEPCAACELVHFRNRMGRGWIDLIGKYSYQWKGMEEYLGYSREVLFYSEECWGHSGGCRIHSRRCRIHSGWYRIHLGWCRMHSRWCRMRLEWCRMHRPRFWMHSARCRMHRPRCWMHSARCRIHRPRFLVKIRGILIKFCGIGIAFPDQLANFY